MTTIKTNEWSTSIDESFLTAIKTEIKISKSEKYKMAFVINITRIIESAVIEFKYLTKSYLQPQCKLIIG
jgi:hypothetical protein